MNSCKKISLNFVYNQTLSNPLVSHSCLTLSYLVLLLYNSTKTTRDYHVFHIISLPTLDSFKVTVNRQLSLKPQAIYIAILSFLQLEDCRANLFFSRLILKEKPKTKH